jgi:uncharacterized protein YciI
MEFDTYTIALLVLRDDAPKLTAAALDELQDAHVAQLHEEGVLLAAGPLPGPSDRRLRGLCIYGVDLERARELGERDPMVRARVFAHDVLP